MERPYIKPKGKHDEHQEREPIGIVISGGPVREAQPVFAAYVWAPAPTVTVKNPERGIV